MPRPRVRRMHGGGNPRFGGGEAEAEEKSVVRSSSGSELQLQKARRGGMGEERVNGPKESGGFAGRQRGFCCFESHNNNNIPNCLFLGFNSN